MRAESILKRRRMGASAFLYHIALFILLIYLQFQLRMTPFGIYVDALDFLDTAHIDV